MDCYTDDYVIAKYYEIFPSDNGMKKDIDRDIAKKVNLSQMRRLWDYLNDNKLVARGEFCPAILSLIYYFTFRPSPNLN